MKAGSHQRAQVRSAFSRASGRYDSAAALQKRVCERLLAGMFPADARCVLDLGCGTGFASGGLTRLFPSARLLAADFAIGMLAAHAAGRDAVHVCADAHALPFAAGSIDRVFSSLMLQWCDPPQVLAECRRVLAPGGRIACATVLDGTLAEIGAAFAGIDSHRHVVSFPRADELHAAVMGAGFVDVSMECGDEVAYFADARSLLQANRDIGASRVPQGARRGLLGRSALAEVLSRLERTRTARGLPLTYRVAWVHARVADGE
ncbi:methyltransferase domain-containing protein [Methyloversatilis thermotolerans]|uniref:methyltransferase domain-containing protein n=1 Tax=Methyloversatilis thermotolerans TaxID=1346290 RepID=UPI00035C6B24|nr:methyltransferase domain-containing protein [Methyloversatilis thermotolerans]